MTYEVAYHRVPTLVGHSFVCKEADEAFPFQFDFKMIDATFTDVELEDDDHSWWVARTKFASFLASGKIVEVHHLS